MNGINKKNHGEHLLIEAAEDKVEVNVSKDTMELSEDQGDLTIDLTSVRPTLGGNGHEPICHLKLAIPTISFRRLFSYQSKPNQIKMTDRS